MKKLDPDDIMLSPILSAKKDRLFETSKDECEWRKRS